MDNASTVIATQGSNPNYLTSHNECVSPIINNSDLPIIKIDCDVNINNCQVGNAYLTKSPKDDPFFTI